MPARKTLRPRGVPSLAEMLMQAAISHAAEQQGQKRWPANPFAHGVRDGSVTSRVLKVVVSHHPRWFEHCELMELTGGSRGAVAWAVRYLQECGMMRSAPAYRNRAQGGGWPMPLRYQAIIKNDGDE